MEHMNEINRQIRRQANFSKALILLFILVSLAGAVASYYEIKSFDLQENPEVSNINKIN
jgi:hypothetical protein